LEVLTPVLENKKAFCCPLTLLPDQLAAATSEELPVYLVKEGSADERLVYSSVELILVSYETGIEGIGQNRLERWHSHSFASPPDKTSWAEFGEDLPERALPLGGQPEGFDDERRHHRIDLDRPAILNDHVVVTERSDPGTLPGRHSGDHGLFGYLWPNLVKTLLQIVTCWGGTSVQYVLCVH
jgi:hypothetical protein